MHGTLFNNPVFTQLSGITDICPMEQRDSNKLSSPGNVYTHKMTRGLPGAPSFWEARP